LAGALIAVVGLVTPCLGNAEDGGGMSLNDGGASLLGQVADLIGNGEDLNTQGVSDLFRHDGDLNQTVDLDQTQVPANVGEITPEQIGQASENRSSFSSSHSERRQSTHSRSW
jgi:hypothetical protein